MVNNIVLDEVFGALASEPRRRMIGMLKQGPHTQTELAKPLGLTLPAIHKHIAVLERAGLISRRKVGREQHVTLEPKALNSAEEWIEFHKAFWTNQLDALEEHITRKNGEV